MASATVDNHGNSSHLHLDSVPLIDLRLLSQSELLSLSLCSPSPTTTSTTITRYDGEDEVSTPKIDRSVFNESAGSRKQTFSRLRLAPRNASKFPPKIPAAVRAEPLDEENSQIISLLKSLFDIQSHPFAPIAIEQQLIPVQIEYKDHSNVNASEKDGLQNIPVDLVTCSSKKRKRGRPRKDESGSGNYWLIENGNKGSETEGEGKKIKATALNENSHNVQNISADVGSCDTTKKKRGRPRKDENRKEHPVVESANNVVPSEGETKKEIVLCVSNKIWATYVNENSHSLQNISVDIGSCDTVKKKRGRPRKDESGSDNCWLIESGNKGSETEGYNNTVKATVMNENSHTLQNILVDVGSCDTIRKKRGRPRKDANVKTYPVVESEGETKKDIVVCEKKEEEEKEMVMENRDGVVVDFVALGNVQDPFGEELRRRTEGMEKEEELLGFVSGLKGEWMSRRKKRRIVNASELGGTLPRGWKLMLSPKRKAGHFWLICRRYISPDGQQFVSCKEVSSYLLSYFGLQHASQPNASHTGDCIQLDNKISFGNAADLKLKDDKNEAEPLFCSPLPLSTEREKQATTILEIKSHGEVKRQQALKCHKCPMSFDEQDDLLQHLLSHPRTAKKSRGSTSISEEVIMKDGKYECQFCHKLFEERSRYNGHLGCHMKAYVKKLGGESKTQKSNEPVPFAAPSEVLKMQESVGLVWDSIANETFNCEANNEISFGLPKADGIVETSTGKNIHECELSHDKQTMKSTGNDGTLVEENCDKQDGVSKITNGILEEMKVDIDVTASKVDVCLGSETVMPNNQNNEFGRPSDEKDVFHRTVSSINNLGRWDQSSQNWSFALPQSNQPYVVDNKVSGVSISSMKEQKQEIGYESGFLSPNGTALSNNQNNEFRRSSDERDVFQRTISSIDNMGRWDQSSPNWSFALPGSDQQCVFDNSVRGISISSMKEQKQETAVKEQRSFKGCSPVPSGNEQRCGSLNNFSGVSTSILTESLQGRAFESGLSSTFVNKLACDVNNNLNSISTSTLDDLKFDGVNNSGNDELTIGFGSNHSTHKPGREDDSEVGLLNLFGSEKVFGFDNNLTKDSAGKAEVPKLYQVRNPSAQLYAVEDNYRVHTSTGHGESRLGKSENARNNELMPAFSYHGQPGVDAMAEISWRTEDNILLQSSGCFPPFGPHPDKGGSGLFDGLRSGSIEHMEYDFLTTQSSSHSESSNLAQGFDSSAWAEKEALPLLPKISSRYNQVIRAVCAWCGNEFHQEPIDSGAETGSVGFMCPSCKSKYSGNHNFL